MALIKYTAKSGLSPAAAMRLSLLVNDVHLHNIILPVKQFGHILGTQFIYTLTVLIYRVFKAVWPYFGTRNSFETR